MVSCSAMLKLDAVKEQARFEEVKESTFNEETEQMEKEELKCSFLSDTEEQLSLVSPLEKMQPAITKKLKFQSVLEGETTAFKCKLVALPPPTILWFHNNRQILKEHHRKICVVSKLHTHLTSLTIEGVKEKDSGSYKVMAINSEGSAESTASLLVSLREEQDVTYFSQSKHSNKAHSSSDSLADSTKERTFRVELRCVGSPFDKTSKGQPRGRHRTKSTLFRTMYFRTSSPSKPSDKTGALETASERARSPTPMYERYERFSDRYSDTYCYRFTGHDRSSDKLSDKFSDKFSDRCSDRYSDRFSDTESLHGEVKAKLSLLQKAVKNKKRMSISTMSSSEFDVESVTSESFYTDYVERLKVKSSALSEQGETNRVSAELRKKSEEVPGIGSQSTEQRFRHSFEPQSRSRAVKMMRGELPIQDIVSHDKESVVQDTSIKERMVYKEESEKEMELDDLVCKDKASSQQLSEEEQVKAKEPFVLQWLEAGEASKQVSNTREITPSHGSPKDNSRPKITLSKENLCDDDSEHDSKKVPVHKLEQRAMSVENILEKDLESERLESEDQFLAQRIRKWQQDVQWNEPQVEPKESFVGSQEVSRTEQITSHEQPASKMVEKIIEETFWSDPLSKDQKRPVDVKRKTSVEKTQALESTDLMSGEQLSEKKSGSKTDSTFTKSRSLSKEKHEHTLESELHLSRARIKEHKSETSNVSQEEELTQRIIKWQQDVLTEQEQATVPSPDWGDVTAGSLEYGMIPTGAASELVPKDINSQLHLTERSKTHLYSKVDSKSFKTESDYFASEEEALAKRIQKWQQEVPIEQEDVELESNWSVTDQAQPATDKTPKDSKDLASGAERSKLSLEGEAMQAAVVKDLTLLKSESECLNVQQTLSEINVPTIEGKLSATVPNHGAPVFVTTLMPNITVKKGDMTELSCQFYGDPQPSVSWDKDGLFILQDPDFDVCNKASSSTLIVYYPTTDHQGVFTCNIANKHGKASSCCMFKVIEEEESAVEFSHEVKVTDESLVTEEQIIEDELKSLMCSEEDGNYKLKVPQAIIHMPQTSVSSIHSSPVEIKITAPTPVLEIVDENREMFRPIEKASDSPLDDGTFQATKHKFTFSFDGDVPQIVKELENLNVVEGQTAVLQCSIVGEPTPEATWFLEEIPLDLNTGKYKVEIQGNIYRLFIENFTYPDSGTYRCRAVNKLGQVESAADVSFDSTNSDSVFLPIASTERTDTYTKSIIDFSSQRISPRSKEVPHNQDLPSMIQHVENPDEANYIQEDAPKPKSISKPASDMPVVTGCGLQTSGVDVKVSKLKQAFEMPESFKDNSVKGQSVTGRGESYFPMEDIPGVFFESEQQAKEQTSTILFSENITESETLIASEDSAAKESVLVPSEENSERLMSSELTEYCDSQHFVPLTQIQEVQMSPALVRPQARLPEKPLRVKALNNMDKQGITEADTQQTQTSDTLTGSDTSSKFKPLSKIEKSPENEEDQTHTEHGAITSKMDTDKALQSDTAFSCDQASSFLPLMQDKKTSTSGTVPKLEEEAVTFSAVYDYYNPPSDWGRPLSPESEMSIEVGSTVSEEVGEIERFFTPGSSTEISQIQKSPEPFHTPSETPGGVMASPDYTFSHDEHKRLSVSSSEGFCSPTQFLASRHHEVLEPSMFTIGEERASLGLGIVQEKVQGIPPAFLKPLTKRRVFEGDSLVFYAEVFGLPTPEVKWFRNKTELVEDERTSIERDGDNIALEIHSVTKADQGEYICEVFNYVGEARSVALVVVVSQEARNMLPPPVVTHQHVIQFDVEEDDDSSRSPSPQEILLEVELDEKEVKEFEKQVKIVTIPEYTADNKSMIISLDVLPSIFKEEAVDFITQESDFLRIAFEVTEMPPRFINPIYDIETPENTNVMFECSLMGIPSPIVSWYKGNIKIPIDKKKYIHSSDGDNHILKILKANTQDSGIYTCRAINVVGETLCRASLMVLNSKSLSGKSRGRELTAVSLGSAIVQPQKFDLVVGNSSFDGEETSEIELEFDFQQEGDESQKAVRLVAATDNKISEHGEKYVSINFDVFAEPSKDDKIEFKGKSTNSCSFQFQVTEISPKCIVPLQNVTAAAGTPVMLQCLVSGKPNPTAEWFKDGAPVKNARYIIQEKASGHFNLLITNVAEADAGEFKCVVQNQAGYTETTSLLKVF